MHPSAERCVCVLGKKSLYRMTGVFVALYSKSIYKVINKLQA